MRKRYNERKLTIKGIELYGDVFYYCFKDYLFFGDWRDFHNLDRDTMNLMSWVFGSFFDGDSDASYVNKKDFERFNMERPDSSEFSVIVEYLLDHFTNKTGEDFTELFEKCKKENDEREKEIKEFHILMDKRQSLINEFMKDFDSFNSLSNDRKIFCLLHLQKMKDTNTEYKNLLENIKINDYDEDIHMLFEDERRLIQLYVQVLVERNFNEGISIWLLESLEQEDFISESDVTKILKNKGINKDYEWYTEDFLGSRHMAKTSVDIDTILEEHEKDWCEKIGIK